jgi:hypothetical protein
VIDGLVYQSNYTSGLRVLDVAGLYDDEPSLEEVAFFDTFPAHGETTFDGTWSNYPFFSSGTIAVSGIDEGLFLLALSSEADDGADEPGDDTCRGRCKADPPKGKPVEPGPPDHAGGPSSEGDRPSPRSAEQGQLRVAATAAGHAGEAPLAPGAVAAAILAGSLAAALLGRRLAR